MKKSFSKNSLKNNNSRSPSAISIEKKFENAKVRSRLSKKYFLPKVIEEP
jgi:hypothetical protein